MTGWDREYLANKEEYLKLFDKTMQKEQEQNVEFLEDSLKKITGRKYAIACSNGTDALHFALISLGIKRFDEVLTTQFSWISTASVISMAGATPVFCDIDPETRNTSAEYIEPLINSRTEAIMVVHIGGQPCNMTEIVELSKKHNLLLIEDSAETLGAKWKKNYTGSFGMGCFSFFPTKNITTTEGGMLTINNRKQYLEVKKIIAHGIDHDKKPVFWHREAVLPGHNFRLPNHLAALGISQLKKLNKFNAKRRLIAKRYDNFLKKFEDVFAIQKVSKNLTHSYQMYTCLLKPKLRNNFLFFMKKNGIEVSAHFVPPLHKQNYLKKSSN